MIDRGIADSVILDLCSRNRAVLLSKNGNPITDALAIGFDALRLFGMQGLPSGAEFKTRFTTTLGPVIYTATDYEAMSPEDKVILVAHECMHVAQWWADPLRMPIWYLQHSEMRAGRYEVEAYASGYEIRWALTGTMPSSVNELAAGVVHGYALTDADKALVQGQVEQYLTGTQHGVLQTATARSVIAVLARIAPDALHAPSVAKIKAVSPELIP